MFAGALLQAWKKKKGEGRKKRRGKALTVGTKARASEKKFSEYPFPYLF